MSIDQGPQERTAIVTGGGTGLGAATARTLARQGVRVVVTGRRAEKLEAICAQIRADGGEALASVGDVASVADVERTVGETLSAFGGVDILVNNAGQHARFRRTHEFSVEEIDECLAVNLRGPFLTTRAVVPHMLKTGRGAIVNVASMAGSVGLRYAAPYSAAKGGLIQLTRATAVEYAQQGIVVTCITPGGMQPAESQDHLDEAQWALIKDSLKQGTPLGRPADVQEVADLIAFLVGPSAAPMAGAIIAVDGGYTAQ
jgi:NAD(P)-dependent dehydrogenase (short-subunit alcohol dehydrogenase family)